MLAARTAADLEGVAASIRERGGSARAVPGDVSNPDDVTRYRDGLLKAGVPFNKAFAESVPRGTTNS